MNQNSPASLRLEVIAPRKLLLDLDVQEVSLPSLEGYIGIFPGHRPLVTALGKGRIIYKATGRERSLSVQGGYAEVQPGKVLVFTELAKDESE
jgi:F-type H+-transporting ATPase subunit epsilon